MKRQPTGLARARAPPIRAPAPINNRKRAAVVFGSYGGQKREAGIRDFVRKDVAHLRRPASGGDSTEREPSAEATVNNVNSLIQRIAGTSRSQIETLVSELESLRDLLHAEGQRVQREITRYAQLSQAAMKSTRMIADNIEQWKRTADDLRNRSHI
jgi:hypothetical protein